MTKADAVEPITSRIFVRIERTFHDGEKAAKANDEGLPLVVKVEVRRRRRERRRKGWGGKGCCDGLDGPPRLIGPGEREREKTRSRIRL